MTGGLVIDAYWPLNDNAPIDGVRTLIVGESHYSASPAVERPDLTRWVLKDHLQHGHYQFFRAIERIVGGKTCKDRAERFNFWSSVAFMNFVSEVLPERSRPMASQYRLSIPRFRRVIREVRPELVCFFSAASWNSRPWGTTPWTDEAFGSEPRHIDGSYEITDYGTDWGERVTMARFNHPRHPGAPFDVWRVWFKYVQALARDKGRPLGRSGCS